MKPVALLLALAACSEASSSPQPAAAAAAPVAAAAAAKSVDLSKYADSPKIDLLANRYRFHQYTGGLLIPLAGPGYAKYTQEYAQPWKDVSTVDGKPGRVLGARGASLRFPWTGGGDPMLRVRVHGGAKGHRVTFRVNAKHLNVSLPAGWAATDVTLPEGLVRRGENEIGIIGQKGSLWHSLEVLTVPAAPLAADAPWPSLAPVSGNKLTGAATWAIPIEIPATAVLRVTTTAAAGTRLAVVAGGKALLETTQRAATDDHLVPLTGIEGELVWLEFRGTPATAWGDAAILLAKAPSRPRPPPVDNVVLVVVDALRSDRLSLHGETRVQMPNLDAAARAAGIWFPHNQAASPSSPPSHGSIQTGMIPRVHGVVGDKAQLLPGVPTISTVLGDAGVGTGYYGNNPFGMARHQKHGRWTSFHQPGMEGKSNDCVTLVKMMLGFAGDQKKAGKRFFISSLPYETHTPYLYNEGITDKYYAGPWDPALGKSVGGELLEAIMSGKLPMTDQRWAQLKGLYDGEAEKADVCIGQLLTGLRALGVAERTAVIVTSDHGEGLFEHGKLGHAFGQWRELGDVPFVILAPGLTDEGRAIDVVTNHIDIAPTIIDLMGQKVPAAMQGTSVLPIALRQGAWPPRVVSLEYGRSYALRARRWKYIVDYNGQEGVYDLEKDPWEQKNLLADPDAAPAVRYLRDLAGFFLAHRGAWRTATMGTLNDHTPALVTHLER